MKKHISFTEEEIQSIFGSEAAEDERDLNLQRYFFKNDAYNKTNAALPLRILVGHKGIGKSAILKIAYRENLNSNKLALWIRPDDIADLCNVADEEKDFLWLIKTWKEGLEQLIYDLILENIGNGINNEGIKPILSKGLKVINSVASMLSNSNFNIDQAKETLVQNFIKHKEIYLYLDDLDRGWKGTPSSIRRISALLSAVRDLSNDNEGLYFRISLRSDVYYLVRTSDESTDKIDGSVIWLSWSSHEILVLLAKRIQTYLGNFISEKELMKKPQFEIAKYLSPVFCERFEGSGKWEDAPIYRILTSMIRRRPRDLVKLCTLAAREANRNRHNQIMTEDFQVVFDRYSQDRIQDVINEHRFELPEIERLVLGMKPSKVEKNTEMAYVYSEEKLLRKIDGIMQHGDFLFASGNKATAKDLLVFMYKINFLIARRRGPDGRLDRRYFEDNKYISTSFATFGYDWEVHPAYRWALYPEMSNIYKTIELDEEI